MKNLRFLWLFIFSTTINFTASTQTVDRPMRIGGDVSAPVLVKQVDPKFSRKMRKKTPGQTSVLVHLVVDEKGLPSKVNIVFRGGEYLSSDPDYNESALKAVEQYVFRPAMYHGKPVATELNVDVTFHLQ